MPTANELLSTEACDDILVVDLESRKIIIPKNVSVLGVEADDETRILHFQIPRHYCDVDLSEFSIQVHYRNANGKPDMYIVTKATIEDELIKFDWIVGRHAFAKKGNVTFSVCLKDLFEGIVRREFNTTIATLPVLEGLETGPELVSEHTDIFEQLRNETADNVDNAVDKYFEENGDKFSGSEIPFLGDNPTGSVDNDTIDTWQNLGSGVAWFSEWNQINNQPAQYGFVINYVHETDVFQFFHDQTSGETYIRSGDGINSWFQRWSRIPTANNDDYISIAGVNASQMVTASNGENSMTMYTNGIGDGNGNIWIDQAGDVWFKAVHIGSGDDYKEVATADIATTETPGLVMVNGNNGIGVNTENGNLFIKQASNNEIDGKAHSYKPITPENLDYAVKAGLVNNTNELSDSERTSVLEWIGAMNSICRRKDDGNVTDLLGCRNGRYLFSNTVAGMPIENEWWFVDVLSSGSTDITVIAHPIITEPKMYVRTCANNVWGSWHQVPVTNSDGELIINGNIKGVYTIGEWLQTTADNHHTNAAEKIAVIDGSGWIYYRTPAEIRSDLNLYTKEEVDAAIAAAIANL